MGGKAKRETRKIHENMKDRKHTRTHTHTHTHISLTVVVTGQLVADTHAVVGVVVDVFIMPVVVAIKVVLQSTR